MGIHEKKDKNLLAEIGGIVKFHRKKSGLSQSDLAKMADVGKTVIYDIEHATTSTRIDTLVKVFKALNIQIHFESPLMAIYKEQKDETSKDSRP